MGVPGMVWPMVRQWKSDERGRALPAITTREYVQDRLRHWAPEVLSLLCRPKSPMYICGLKGIEEGVDEALVDIGRLRGIDWLASQSEMRAPGRYPAPPSVRRRSDSGE